MARYGKSASKTVASAMRRKKKGTPQEWLGPKGDEPQTSHRHWAQRVG